MWLLVALACSGNHTVVAGPPAEVPASMHGTRIDPPLAVPAFARVVAQDGSPRGANALLGRPTVLWFYPAAGTGG